MQKLKTVGQNSGVLYTFVGLEDLEKNLENVPGVHNDGANLDEVSNCKKMRVRFFVTQQQKIII